MLKIIFSAIFLVSLTSLAAGKKTKPKIKKSEPCKNTQVLSDAAQKTIENYVDPDDEEGAENYLILSDDPPSLIRPNVKGKDLWSVPVVMDGEGCYGDVYIEVKANSCEIVGEPSFDGVSCTDD